MVHTYFYFNHDTGIEYYYFSTNLQEVEKPWTVASYGATPMDHIRRNIITVVTDYQVIEVLNPNVENIPTCDYTFRELSKFCVNFDKEVRWAVSGVWPKEYGLESYFGILEYCTSLEDARHRLAIMRHYAENSDNVVKEKVKLHITKHKFYKK